MGNDVTACSIGGLVIVSLLVKAPAFISSMADYTQRRPRRIVRHGDLIVSRRGVKETWHARGERGEVFSGRLVRLARGTASCLPSVLHLGNFLRTGDLLNSAIDVPRHTETGDQRNAEQIDITRHPDLDFGMEFAGLVEAEGTLGQGVFAAGSNVSLGLAFGIDTFCPFVAIAAKWRYGYVNVLADELFDVGIKKAGVLGYEDEIYTSMPVGFECGDFGRDLGRQSARAINALCFINDNDGILRESEVSEFKGFILGRFA